MAKLEIKNLIKTYGQDATALNGISLEIMDGEFVVLVGPSGCGKSTTLRIIAGLEEPTSGEILLNGQSINNIPSSKRDMAMVFQNYALYSTKTVFENIAFPLRMRKMKMCIIKEKVAKTAELIGISSLLSRMPDQLSGGEKQRVAIARALVRQPNIFLMDEPLSNLDAKLKMQFRNEIAGLHQRLGITTVYVTHDQVEAMTLADRIIVMKDGEIIQKGTPREIYEKPSSPFVAGFFGNPPMNFFEKDGSLMGIRPEDIQIEENKSDVNTANSTWHPVEITRQELLGAQRIYYLKLEEKEIIVSTSAKKHVCKNHGWIKIEKSDLHRF